MSVAGDQTFNTGAAFDEQVSALAESLIPHVRPDADFAEQRSALQLLVTFASKGTGCWPQELLRPEVDGYATHCLIDRDGWSVAVVVLDAGQTTPAHDHPHWGAAATAQGCEANLILEGSCPRGLTPFGLQVAALGSGYLFPELQIHQAQNYAALSESQGKAEPESVPSTENGGAGDGSAQASVSLHLLVQGPPREHTACTESHQLHRKWG